MFHANPLPYEISNLIFSEKQEKVCINVVFAKPEDFETWENILVSVS